MFQTFSQFFCRNILIDHWNYLSSNLIVYGVENFRLSWRFVVKEGPMYGRELYCQLFENLDGFHLQDNEPAPRLLPLLKYKPQSAWQLSWSRFEPFVSRIHVIIFSVLVSLFGVLTVSKKRFFNIQS